MDNTPSRLGHIPRTYSTRFEHSFISPLIEEKDYVPYRVSTSQMDNTPSRLGHIPRTYSTRSEHSFISLLIEEKDYVPYRVSTSQVSERDENNHHVDKVFKTKENIVKTIYNTKDAEITESEMNFSL
ncbi:hypothetical protein M9H77_31204 [Catharanthus roseus]|uniref:Uncharacterized protein n=1 Tax=Catharanthus roseus TaxID=4058 RepID=A0ACC0A228_CATRO|nr:hypothetical protein M9H77_31204 [Catharanthus roseus]